MTQVIEIRHPVKINIHHNYENTPNWIPAKKYSCIVKEKWFLNIYRFVTTLNATLRLRDIMSSSSLFPCSTCAIDFTISSCRSLVTDSWKCTITQLCQLKQTTQACWIKSFENSINLVSVLELATNYSCTFKHCSYFS